MKKNFLLLCLFLITSLYVQAQISTCAYYDGYWGEWKKQYYTYSESCRYKIYGNYSGFIVHYNTDHPSKYIFKFQADSYSQPTKETIKYHWKNKTWYEYNGFVEYFIDNSYPTIKSALKTWSFAFITNTSDHVKRTARATIKIAPYKDHPRVYNIYFEDVGIAIDLGRWSF